MASFDRNDYGYYPISYTNNTEWGAEPPFGTPVTEVVLGNEENPNVKNPSYNPNGAYNKIYGSAARWNQRANPNPVYPPQYQPTMDDYINQMENENSAAWQYSGGGRTEPLMPNVRQGGNVLYELLQSVFNDRGNNLSQFGREQSIRDTLARDGIY